MAAGVAPGPHAVAIGFLKPHEQWPYWIVVALSVGVGVFAGLTIVDHWDDPATGGHPALLLAADVLLLGSFALLTYFVDIRRLARARRRINDICRRCAAQPDARRWQPGDAEVVLAAVVRDAGITMTRTRAPDAALNYIRRGLTRFGIRAPAVILDADVAPELFAVQRVEHLLEPEPVRNGTLDVPWKLAILAVPFIALVITGWAACFTGALAIVVVLFALRRLIINLQLGGGVLGSGLVAGTGYIETAAGRRIGSWQALTLVTRDQSGRIYVRLLLEHGFIAITFPSTRDREFITFWQRWNHPHPRPELLGK